MRVLIDTCVLYPTVMRQVVLGVAEKGLFEPRWSPRILEEWARVARKVGPEGEVIARGEIARINAQFPQASAVVNYVSSDRLWLPDPGDVHVLAAALNTSADAIMTLNAKDFPRNALADEGLERLDPDGFLIDCYDRAPQEVTEVAEAVRQEASRLSGADWEIRKLMRKARLPRLGKRLALA